MFSKLAALIFEEDGSGTPGAKDIAPSLTDFARARATESDQGTLAEVLGDSFKRAVQAHSADISKNLGETQTQWPGSSSLSRAISRRRGA